MTTNQRDFDGDRAIIDAATAGPWIDNGNEIVAASDLMCGIAGAMSGADNKFIAEARTGWPAALDRIAELEAENSCLKSDLLTAHIDERTAYVSAETYYNEIQRYRQALESLLSVINGGYVTKNKPSAHVDDALRLAKEALGGGE